MCAVNELFEHKRRLVVEFGHSRSKRDGAIFLHELVGAGAFVEICGQGPFPHKWFFSSHSHLEHERVKYFSAGGGV